MAGLMILRPIHPLPGRHQDALAWLTQTEPVRRNAGQITQYVLRSVIDSREFLFVQVWESREAYERWRETPERAGLADERQRFLTHDPTRLFEVVS